MSEKPDPHLEMWKEVIANSAEDCGAVLTTEQIGEIAGAAQGHHENYDLCFYSPPASDRLADIEAGWKRKMKELQAEFDGYRATSEKAIKRALHRPPGDSVSIDANGNVYLHGGRTVQIL